MAGNDQIIFKGKVYGNTVNVNSAIIAKAPDEIEIDGTEIYQVGDPQSVDVVEIANGGRISYGTSDINTIVCQGIKMTRYNSIREAFINGFLRPTDLYTSFTLKHCFKQDPVIGDEAGSGPWVAENYNLMATYAQSGNNVTYVYYNFIPKDVISDRNEPYSGCNTTNTSTTISKKGYSIFESFNDSQGYKSKFPLAFNSVNTASSVVSAATNRYFNRPQGTEDYLGMYFIVKGVSRTDDNTLWVYNKSGYSTTYINNTFCISPSYRLPSITSGTYSLNDGEIVSKLNGTYRTFYIYDASQNKIIYCTSSTIKNRDFIYCGDISDASIPETGNSVTLTSFPENETIDNIIHQWFGDNSVIYKQNIPKKANDYFVSNKGTTTKFSADKYVAIQGYATITPFIVGLRVYGKNKMPRFYVPSNVRLPSQTGTITVLNRQIVSVATREQVGEQVKVTRQFYTYHSNSNCFSEFKMEDIIGSSFIYKGDVESIPETGGTVTKVPFTEDDTMREIITQMFETEVTIIDSDNNEGDISLSSSDSTQLYFSGKDIYVDVDSTGYIISQLIFNQDSEYQANVPFLNAGEMDFALGIRQKLDYITVDEYNELIGDN